MSVKTAMAKRNARERRHERTRDAILSATMDLIVEKGFNNLSLREVAQRVDYSPAGLYEYFGSKDELIAAACIEGDKALGDYLRLVDQSLPLDQYLIELGLAYVRFARERTNTFTFLFTARTVETQSVITGLAEAVSHEDSFAILLNAIQRGIDTGWIQHGEGYSAMDISYSLWAMVHGMATLQSTYLQSWDHDFAHADRRAIETFVKGMTSR